MQAVKVTQLTNTNSCNVLTKQFRPHRTTVCSESVLLPLQTTRNADKVIRLRCLVSSLFPPSKAKIPPDKNETAVRGFNLV
jgi:hypothetical protein